ncbi:MAG: SGNH/GDSL hydrolase family protein [Microlunatus sp.]|nr:SGNH/GDSL hydrolase family protein [Microlunatus sp.]
MTATAEQLGSFAQTRVFFGHQSVGNNIIDGLRLLYTDSKAGPLTIRATSEVEADAGVLAHTMVGVNGDPQSKIDEFAAILSRGLADEMDVVILKFCYVDITRGTDVQTVFDEYSTALDTISRQHPRLRVVYTTVPLTTKASWKSKLKALVTRNVPPSTADNIAREQYNALVRNKYESTGRLFDVARVESTAPDGSRATDVLGDSRYFALDEELALDSGHLNDVGSMLAAQEFVRVVLR